MARASGLLLLCLCGTAAQEVRLNGVPLTNTFTPAAAGQPWGLVPGGQLAPTVPSWAAGLTYVAVPGVGDGGVFSFVSAEEAAAPRRGVQTLAAPARRGAQTLAPANTCVAQTACTKWTVERADPTAACDNDECVWTACLELDLDAPGCQKSSRDTLSHTCVKDNNQCPVAAFSVETQNPGHGHRQCQTGRGGDTLTFLLKDGKGCGLASRAEYTDESLPTGSSVTCAGRQAGEWTCTGNGAGKECLWRVELPECTETRVAETSGPRLTETPEPRVAETSEPQVEFMDPEAPSRCPTAFYVAGYVCSSDDQCTSGVTGNLEVLLVADGWTRVAPGPRFTLPQTGDFRHATWAYGKVVAGELALPGVAGSHTYVGVFHSTECSDTVETGTTGGDVANPGPVNSVCVCPPWSAGFAAPF